MHLLGLSYRPFRID